MNMLILAMMLPYSFHEDVAIDSHIPEAETPINTGRSAGKRTTKELHFILDKVTPPARPDLVERPRITDFLQKAAVQFRANLISGRAETGKTCVAVDLARRYSKVAWYSIDPGDADWEAFAKYLVAAVAPGTKVPPGDAPTAEDLGVFLADLFARARKKLKKEEMLIVLDDLHHIFDAPWFGDFFTLLLSSAVPETHILMLCRSKPPLPLWRMRSKQILNVVDERMLAFDEDEIAALCRKLGMPEKTSRQVPAGSFGRAGKVVDFLTSASTGRETDAPRNTLDPVLLANIDPFVP